MTTTDPDFPALLDGWVADDAHHYPLRVQFEDTNAGGIVYQATYLAFAERARSGFLRWSESVRKMRSPPTRLPGGEVRGAAPRCSLSSW